MSVVGLGTKLRKLLSSLDGEVQALYNEGGFSFRPKYFPVFQALLRSHEADVAHLADLAQVSQPAMTQTLRELEKAGLVNSRSGEDRRQKLISLTPAALKLAERLQPLWTAISSAAESLERDLPVSLASSIDQALLALSAKSFRSRIEEEL